MGRTKIASMRHGKTKCELSKSTFAMILSVTCFFLFFFLSFVFSFFNLFIMTIRMICITTLINAMTVVVNHISIVIAITIILNMHITTIILLIISYRN